MKISQEDLAEIVDAVGGSFGKMMDKFRKGLLPVFRCAHSGLLLPGDYLKSWGEKYGVGLGPHPVSEVLDTNYLLPLDTRPDVKVENIHHGIQVSMAQVDLMLVHPSEVAGVTAILHHQDVNYTNRMKILLKKQWVNPKGQLKRYRPDLAESMKGVS
jgi:hypothetical protein